MRIAYLSNFAPRKLGTGENRLVELSREAKRRGHALTMYCHEPIHPDVRNAFDASDVDIVPLSAIAANPLRSAWRLARSADAVLLNAIAPRSLTALVCYFAWPSKVFYIDHSSGPVDDLDYSTRPYWKQVLDRLTVVRIARLAGVSDYVTDRLRSRFALSGVRATTLYGGVDTDRFSPSSGPLRDDVIQITVVAALIPEKGIDVLLRALAELPNENWRLSVAGDGPDKPRLEALTRELGLQNRTRFPGLRNDVDRILKETHIFVHPAIWAEALGYTVLEGMSSGCAMIATRTGGIPELVEHEKNGLLVTPGSVAEMREALQRLMAHSSIRTKIAGSGRETVLQRFTLSASVGRILDWVEHTVDRTN